MTNTVFSHAGLGGHRLVDLVQEVLTAADVGVRVVVVLRCRGRLVEEARVDEARPAGSEPAAHAVRKLA